MAAPTGTGTNPVSQARRVGAGRNGPQRAQRDDPRGHDVADSADRYDRRTFLGRGAASAAGLALAGAGAPVLLSACGASGPSGPSTASSATTTPGVSTAKPRRGGSVIIGMSSEIDGFLPAQSHFDNTGLTYANAVFDTLTAVAADGSIRPHLAASVVPNADMTAWTVTLRPNVGLPRRVPAHRRRGPPEFPRHQDLGPHRPGGGAHQQRDLAR